MELGALEVEFLVLWVFLMRAKIAQMWPGWTLPAVISVSKDKLDGLIAPAYFSPGYNVFDTLLQTIKNREYSSEPSFQRSSTNINSTTNFYNPWHYRLTSALRQSVKSEVRFWITFWKFEIILSDLDGGYPIIPSNLHCEEPIATNDFLVSFFE